MAVLAPFCDWIAITLETDEPPFGSTIFKYDQETGEVDFSKCIGRPVMGSFSKNIWVHCTGSQITFSGNPTKHFTGQNFYGISDLPRLVTAFVEYGYRLIERDMPERVRLALETGSVKISRLDLCDHVKLPNDEIARQALYTIGETATQERRGRAVTHDTTVEFSPDSRHSKTKLYLKSVEMRVKGHEVECDRFLQENIKLDAPGVIRRENEFYGRMLQRHNLDLLRDWTPEKATELHNMMLKKIDIPKNQAIDIETMADAVDRKHRLTLEAWKAGRDMRTVLSERTFHRHRKEIRLKYGIDIGVRPDLRKEAQVKQNVIPLRDVIKVQPFQQSPEITQYLIDLMEKQLA